MSRTPQVIRTRADAREALQDAYWRLWHQQAHADAGRAAADAADAATRRAAATGRDVGDMADYAACQSAAAEIAAETLSALTAAYHSAANALSRWEPVPKRYRLPE